MNRIEAVQRKLAEKNIDAILALDEKNQKYASGFPIQDGYVLVSRKGAYMVTDSRYIEAAHAALDSYMTVTQPEGGKSAPDLLNGIIEADGIKTLGFEESAVSYADYKRLAGELRSELVPAQCVFSELRAVKVEEEIVSMRKAQRISEKALDAVLGIIRPGMTENDVCAELTYYMLKYGSEGNSFDPIVVCGNKTSMPHGVPGDKVIREGDFLTMDFGSLVDGYCSDMTRTVAVGFATDEMKSVYDVVLRAQLAGIAAAKAGVKGKAVDGAARKVIEDAGYGKYFGHGFGHSLGLNIHESPNANMREERCLPVNTVISAEPGIYLPGKFGVRIEDVIIIKEDGCENITEAPKQLIILNN